MADDLKNRGGQDRKRININETYELAHWSKKLGVTKEMLKDAVQAVGDQADKVEQHLMGARKPAKRASERSI